MLILVATSCGKNDADEHVSEAILSANIALSNFECDKAINILEAIGRQNNHAKYLQTLSSAYACKGGFKAPTFFASDVILSNSPLPLGGLSRYSTSSVMDDPENTKYINLEDAIDILLYSGGILATQNPTVTERSTRFSAAEAGDINAQLLYMMLVQLGRYFYFYGDASSTTGVKGAGDRTLNNCFISYEALPIAIGTLDNYLGAPTNAGGACTGVGLAGHPYLGAGGGTIDIKLACQAIVLLNNIFDVLPSVTASISGTDLNSLSGLTNAITLAKAALTLAVAGEPQAKKDLVTKLLTVQSQTRCEADNELDDDGIQYFFAYFFEVLIQ